MVDLTKRVVPTSSDDTRKRIRELATMHERNAEQIRVLQSDGWQIEWRLVKELATAGEFEVLKVNWSRLKHNNK